mgnify:FL=1
MSAFFIKHPAIAAVIAIVTTLLGLVCMFNLPISQYPEITPRTIQLQAMFPGASAQAVADSVGTPLERQISGVQGMDYMTSVSSNNGVYNLSVIFEPGSDTDIDQVLTNMRYGQASSQLPQEVQSTGVTIKQQPGLPLMIYSLTSPDGSYNSVDLANYAQVKLVDELKRVEGVGEVQVYGAGRYAIRIWLDTSKMTHYGVSVNEVRGAISAQNTTNPGGKIGADPVPDGQEQTITVRTQGRLSEPHEFEDIIIRQNGDEILYLKDIAKVELGAEDYSATGRLNGEVSAAIVIFQSPGSNAIATADRVEKLLEAKAPLMPEGITGRVSLDTTTAVRYSIDEIKHTFMEAVILVALVVYVFLQNWRATLIPLIAVPVSLISTFCLFPVLGFSLNTISLLGMVLAIGLVVDDAIVVVEAVQEHIDKGLNPRMASFAAMQEVSGPVIAIALVLAAVFLPSLLLEGITGTLFKQFAVTIAISMLISAFNALTLSPALSAILLKPKDPSKGGPLKFFYRIFNRSYDATASGYTKVCHFLTRKLIISIPLLALIAYAIVPVAKKIPNGFLPDEDQGYLFAALIMPEARSLQLTTAAADKVSELIRQNPNVKDVIAISGFSLLTGVQSTNNAFFFVMLKPWEERPNPDQSAQAVTAQLNALLTTKVSEGITMCFQPPAIAGVGSANGVTFMLEDRDGKGTEYLAEQTDIFVKEANKLPIFDPNNNGGVRSVMSFAVEQKDVRLDEEKCATLGVSISEANSLLQAYMGSLFINYITLYGQQWQVYIQAQGSDRTGTDMLKNFYVKNNTGSSVPLSTLVKITDIKGPEFLLRQNLYNSSKLMVTPAQGYSNSQAMEALEKTFEASMPSDMGYSYADMSYQEQKIQNGIGIVQIFLLSSVFVFLILAALYERWSLPLSIFMTVPIAALGAFLGLYWFGYELNLYAQIGLVMLIGLAAKNAILIVEFAVIEMERGKTLMEATLSAARIRLRPILMTSFAFILGCVPLALASGSGAYSRNIIGIVVIFLIPCSFYFIMKLFRVRIARKTVETEDPDEIIARKHLFHEAHESLKG